MGLFDKRCFLCDQKQELIDGLIKANVACPSCVNLKFQIEHLKILLDKEHQERRIERAEFKRAIDRLITHLGSHPVNQGALPNNPERIVQEKTPTPQEMFAIFKETDKQGNSMDDE